MTTRPNQKDQPKVTTSLQGPQGRGNPHPLRCKAPPAHAPTTTRPNQKDQPKVTTSLQGPQGRGNPRPLRCKASSAHAPATTRPNQKDQPKVTTSLRGGQSPTWQSASPAVQSTARPRTSNHPPKSEGPAQNYHVIARRAKPDVAISCWNEGDCHALTGSQ